MRTGSSVSSWKFFIMLQACIKITQEEINSTFDTESQTVAYGELQEI